MAPKAASATTMKQGTLSFASSKRGAAATAPAKANALKQSLSISTVKPPASERKETASRTVSSDSTATAHTISSTSIPSEDEIVVISTASTTAIERESKRLKTASGAAKPLARSSKRPAATYDSSSEDEEDLVTPGGNLQTIEKSGKLSKLYAQAREKNGFLPLVHADKQTNVHHILRVFDNSYEYGPCAGMTRLQRWERANTLGLSPPAEIREILLTEEASEEKDLKESVFYGEL